MASFAQAAPPPAEAFGTLPQVGNVAMNPQGNLLAWSDNGGAAPVVVIFDLDTRTVKRTVDIGSDMKLRAIDWADDETVLLEVSDTRTLDNSGYASERARTLSANIGGGPARMLLMTGERRVISGSTLLALRAPQPRTVIMSSWDFERTKDRGVVDTLMPKTRRDTGWVLNLFEVNTATGKGERIEQGTQFTDDWIIDANGQAVARTEWDPQKRVYRIQRKDGRGWTQIYREQDSDGLSVYGLTDDGSSILAVGAMGQSHSKAWAIPLKGSPPRVVIEDPQYEIESIVRDPYSNAPIGARIGGPEPGMHWFDPTTAARQKALEKTFAGRKVLISGRAQDWSRAIAYVSTHSSPGVYYLVDFSKGTADIIGEDYPALQHAALGTVRAITYKARDGADIPAYITMPPGVPEENLPMVVLPHGGPESRDETAFDWLAQFIATRGFVVLQPQFRGSTGFGEAHRKAGYHQWGGVMQDDVTDGVRAMTKQHIADPRRVAVVGASYGGYVALAGAAFTPNLYACAVSISGVADLPSALGYSHGKSGNESDTLTYWRISIGSVYDRNVVARSPARAADKIHVPILLLHGVDDTVVPISQSETMARALDRLDKKYRLVRLPGEDHWLSRSATRISVLTEIEKFLAEEMPDGGA